MTSYFMSLWSTAQVTGLTCNFTLKCTISQDTFWPNSGAWHRSWLAYSAWQSGVVGICAPRASPRSAKFSWSVKGNLCRCDSLQMLGQGRLGCQAALSAQHFRHASFAPKNLPLRLSLQEAHISWVSLWVSSSNGTKKKLRAKPASDPLSFTWLLPERATPVFSWNIAQVRMQFNTNPVQLCRKVYQPHERGMNLLVVFSNLRMTSQVSDRLKQES